MKTFGLLIAAATLMLAGAAHAEVCSQPALARTATLVFDAHRTLNGLPSQKDKETDLPPASRKAIATMKTRLNDYIVATMRCAPEKIEVTKLGLTLTGFADVRLPEGVLIRNPSPPAHSFGEFPQFDIRVLRSDAVGIVARFGIHCGEDALLMIFERRGDAWVEALRSQSAPYKTVAGGWWSFEYAVSPRDKDGHWFVVSKNVAPWCSSTWSEIRYQVLRPGPDAVHPHVLLSKADDIWWGPDRFGDLKVDAKGFDLRWPAESMDPDLVSREWIAHYDVDGDRAIRDAPIANSPRDFADEWVRLPWPEAKHWTPNVAYGLRPLHDALRKQHYFTYVSARRCSDEDHTQLEVEPSGGNARHVFFQVAGSKSWMMRDVTSAADPHCKGPNLYNADHPQQ